LRHLSQHLDRLDEHPALWRSRLERAARRPGASGDERLRGELALARQGAAGRGHLAGRALAAEPLGHGVLPPQLGRGEGPIRPAGWGERRGPRTAGGRRIAAASALADYAPQDPRWEAAATRLVRDLSALDPLLAGDWVDALYPVRERLRGALVERFDDPS